MARPRRIEQTGGWYHITTRSNDRVTPWAVSGQGAPGDRQVAGDEWEQGGARRLGQRRPGLEAVIGCVERVRAEKWEKFRDRHGDRGRDLVLYVARTMCGLKLLELARAVGLREYPTVAMAVKRYAGHLRTNMGAQRELRRVMKMLTLKM